MWINYIILAIIGFGAGIVISGGVFAFIAVIGLIPRIIRKTNTQDFVHVYEDAVTFGGIFGVLCLVFNIRVPIGVLGSGIFGIFAGVFVGGLAVSLAEVLNVIPILTRRMNIHRGMSYLIVALAMGKMIGSLVYYLIPGFAQYK
ncbi:stage V sporulation protein AB [Natranaerovirga hydrolytica]|uniref:Stage V sporulation protein AB n=1 Tax=Natranaerovirga hydrolytica TaxID=680378 RepID=A0A4R1MPM3_9FIRM|nr:stage V sporulation protein AB [Natranaerovirga hydrolytica]TCK92439.1 stage V sporulation protein AB [Natranaerovirga hydrolytica]